MSEYQEILDLAWSIHIDERERQRPRPEKPDAIEFWNFESVLAILNAISAVVLSALRTYALFLVIASASFARQSPLAVAEAISAVVAFDVGVVSFSIRLGRHTKVGGGVDKVMQWAGIIMAFVVSGAAGIYQTAYSLGNSSQQGDAKVAAMYAIGVLTILYTVVAGHNIGYYLRRYEYIVHRDAERFDEEVAAWREWINATWAANKKRLLGVASRELGYDESDGDVPGEKGKSLAQRVREYLAEHPQAKTDEIASALGIPDEKRGSLATTVSRIRKG